MDCKRYLSSNDGGLTLVVDPSGLPALVNAATQSPATRAAVVSKIESGAAQLSREAANAGALSSQEAEKAGLEILRAQQASAVGDTASARSSMSRGRDANRRELKHAATALSKQAMASKMTRVASSLKGFSRGGGLGAATSGTFQGAMAEASRPDTINVQLPPAAIARSRQFGVNIAGEGWVDADARSVGGGTSYNAPHIIGVRADSYTYASREGRIGARLAGLGDAAQFNTAGGNIFSGITSGGKKNVSLNSAANSLLNGAGQTKGDNSFTQVLSLVDTIAKFANDNKNALDQASEWACENLGVTLNSSMVCGDDRKKFIIDNYKAKWGAEPSAAYVNAIVSKHINWRDTIRNIINAARDVNATPPVDHFGDHGGNQGGGGGGGGGGNLLTGGASGTMALVAAGGAALIWFATRKK